MSELKKNIKWLTSFYSPIKRRLILILLQSVIVALLAALMPYLFIWIIDGIEEKLSGDFLLKAVILLLSLGIMDSLFSVTNALRRAYTNVELEWQFRQKTFEHIIRLDQRFYENFRIGDIVTRLTDDVGDKLSWFASSGVFRAWESSLRIFFCLVAMFFINPWLCLVSIIPLPLHMILFSLTAPFMQQRFKALQEVISRVNETIESCFSGIRIIQAYGMENKQRDKFSHIAGERADAEIRAEKIHIMMHALFHYFWQLAQIIVLVGGGWMVIKDMLSVGEFVAFDYYVLHMIWPMFDISGLLIRYKRAAVSIKRLNDLEEFKATIENPSDPLEPAELSGKLIFKDVTLKIKEKTILDSISFDINNNRMIAVVGEVGAGKSTLLKLLCRFYDPDSGEVILDNTDLKRYPLEKLRKRTGYVSQEPLLFTDSVTENIKFGRDDIDKEKALSSASVAQLTEEVNSFKEGFDTSIGLRGMTVSGGQKQRISIARAIAGSPDILILDDATSHLDADTEKSLWEYIYKVVPHMRIFLVSHRPATLEQADLILVLKEGKLVEKGKHRELLDKKGEYYRIYSREKLEEIISR